MQYAVDYCEHQASFHILSDVPRTCQYLWLNRSSVCQRPGLLSASSRFSLLPLSFWQHLLIFAFSGQWGQGSGSRWAQDRRRDREREREGWKERGMERESAGGNDILFICRRAHCRRRWAVTGSSLPGAGQFPLACLGAWSESRGLIRPPRNTRTHCDWLTLGPVWDPTEEMVVSDWLEPRSSAPLRTSLCSFNGPKMLLFCKEWRFAE